MKRKTKIARRMWNIHLIDTELERGFRYGLKLKKEDVVNDL